MTEMLVGVLPGRHIHVVADSAYASKAQPSTADMAAKLRRVIIAARFKASRPDQPTSEEISVLCLA